MSGKSTKKNTKKKPVSAKFSTPISIEPEFDEAYAIEEPKRLRLSFQIIVKRNLPPEASKWSHEEVVKELSKVSHVRLDRENIGFIDNLELMSSKVTNLYLQNNKIQTIENLECLTNLRFLTLSGNKIRKIEGLSLFKHLGLLDLSQNLIQTFDIDELPQSLIILNLRDNPCTHMSDYRGSIIQDLHNLKQLDGTEVSRTEKREVGFAVSSESDDDGEYEEVDEEEEEVESRLPEIKMEGPVTRQSIRDVFGTATSDILIRSQKRLERYNREHKHRMNTLEDYRAESDLPPSSARTARSNASSSLSTSQDVKPKSKLTKHQRPKRSTYDSDSD